MFCKNQKYVIGVDGGGTKTVAVLANLNGKVLARAEVGPSNINKVGFKHAIDNIVKVLTQVSQEYEKDKIVFIYLGLAAGLERDKRKKKEIKKQLLLIPSLSWVLPKNISIEGDQLIAFRSGTEEKQGIIIIAGTGSIVMGWDKKGKEVIVGGWDYLLGDDGSGFWIGKKALQAVCLSIDGFNSKSLLHPMILKKLKIKTEKDLMQEIYKPEMIKNIASLAPLVETAAKIGDKTAKDILFQASNKLIIRVNLVIKKLNLENKFFPLVLAGGVFKSKIILTKVKKDIKIIAPKANFIRLKQEPVIGAMKLALEQIS